MANFIVGLVIVFGGWYLLKTFANAQPAQVRGLIRKVGGGAIIAFSGLLAIRGQINLAMPLFLLGLGLMGQQAVFPNGMPWQRRTAGQRSRVATSLVAMELEHDTGRMDGEVLSGLKEGDEVVAGKREAEAAAAPQGNTNNNNRQGGFQGGFPPGGFPGGGFPGPR